jgi:hypothetical protein
MTDTPGGNGRFHGDTEPDDAPDDDAPLTLAEAVAADAAAGEAADETLDERVEAVIEGLEGVERLREDESVHYRVGGRDFAVLMQDVLEVALDPAVTRAAIRTPATMASSRGGGWLAFAPDEIDRFALDRAEAWLRSAYRRATGG